MNWKIVLIGLTLLGLSAFVNAAYNPYINNGYGRPYYTQFHSLPGVPREAQLYYGTNVLNYGYSNGFESYSETVVQNPGYCYSCAVYSPYYYYRSPAAFAAPTVSVYTPPVIPIVTTGTVVYHEPVYYSEPVGLVSTAKYYGKNIGASFKIAFAG